MTQLICLIHTMLNASLVRTNPLQRSGGEGVRGWVLMSVTRPFTY